MTTLIYLIPVALFLSGLSLVAFLWALRSGQYEDMDGAAERIFIEDDGRGCGSPRDVNTRAKLSRLELSKGLQDPALRIAGLPGKPRRCPDDSGPNRRTLSVGKPNLRKRKE